MAQSGELTSSILAIMYAGDIVFAVSGALVAGRYRMDVLGFVMVGVITGIGGGTTRDLLIGRTVWWTQQPLELLLCAGAALATYFWVGAGGASRRWAVWADAAGLSAFAVVGCHVALAFGLGPVVAVFMGMVTATGGGVIRDVITNNKPMIMGGQLYATAALLGSATYAGLYAAAVPERVAELLAFGVAFGLRGAAIHFDIRMGPPGEFLRVGGGVGENGTRGNGVVRRPPNVGLRRADKCHH